LLVLGLFWVVLGAIDCGDDNGLVLRPDMGEIRQPRGVEYTTIVIITRNYRLKVPKFEKARSKHVKLQQIEGRGGCESTT
jgi:hypothetical protein